MDPLRYRTCDGSDGPSGWRLLWVARADSDPGLIVTRSAHRHCSISFIESGYGTVCIAGSEARLGPGDAFILPEGMDHQLRCDQERPWRQLFAAFSGALPAQLLQAYDLSTVHVFQDAPIAQPLRNLLAHAGDDRDLQIRSGAALHEILGILYRQVHHAPDWPQLVIRAKAFIDSHIEHGLRVSAIAQHVGCSESYLSRNFRRYVGHPPGVYILRRRMDLARVLLTTTDLPIKAIADRLAYHDSFAFSHAFKAETGCSPSIWRNQVLAGRRSAGA